MGYICSMMFFLLASGVVSQAALVYNFEGTSVPSEISSPSSLQLSTSRYKKGSKSLKWQWSAGQQLTWNLASKTVNVVTNGGIKIWIYNSVPIPQKCLSICIRQIRGTIQTDSCFPLSLNFEGWRAAWVSFKEFLGCSSQSSANSVRSSPTYRGTIDRFFLIAPSGETSTRTLHIDFLQFVQMISIATRDSIVPPLTYLQSNQTYCTSCSKIYSGLSEENALSYKRSRFWQHIYRWSLRSPSPKAASEVDITKLNAINSITRRLVNWYASESTAFTIIPHRAVSPSDPFLIHRWESLVKSFDDAHQQFKKLTRSGSNTATSGLFSRNDKSKVRGGPEEFSFVHHRVLLPLTLEYYIKSRPIEVEHVACELAKKYTCSPTKSLNDADIEAITGKDSSLKNSFRSFYGTLPTSSSVKMHASCSSVKQVCFEHVEKALEDINNIRKTKIIGLFKYLKDQGLNSGSGLGSMDHELLQMSGYVHSMFLMRKYLKSDVIDAMKWYVEFGEVYQTSFEYKGTTADRTRTAMLYRLMTVLAMPEDNDVQKSKKIRDMDALKKWIENALSITEGLSGLIKPDYTCFHHKTFYASAYCPAALHTAALVSYLLEETAYQLDSQIRTNIINTLKVLRIAAVRYSTPSQVGGRFPKYNKAILAEIAPAFAYMAMKYDSHGLPNLNTDLAEVRMFLRLYEHVSGTCDGLLNRQLCNGKASRLYYLNTLGSLEIMEKVKDTASKAKVTAGMQQWYYEAEQSQSGHWTKQFAALSIHRRDDWAVTVKGFDKYVWDFESGGDNVYGMYGSHGAMLIANSESALNSKIIDKGWDWRKIPGTTVISVPYSDMASLSKRSTRHYNPSKDAMAGGVFFQGSKSKTGRNGVFGMNFQQPSYNVQSGSPFHQVDFSFKKSVFFYDDIIVSLGSRIQYSGGQYEIHTTLFQDLIPQTSSSTTSQSASNIFRCNDGGPLTKTSWSNMALAILVDVNGNRYYIPKPDNQDLVFSRKKRQDSLKGNKDNQATHGTYCTAWFNHGKNPSGVKNKYEYAVQIEAETTGRPQKPQLVPQHRYSVIKQGINAHVVKFNKHDNRGTVYGYVVFPKDPKAAVKFGRTGPLKSVLHQSIIMAEETTNPQRLYISVKSPQLMLREKNGSASWCQGGTTSPSKSGDVDETLLFCSKSTDHAVHVNLRNNAKWSRLSSLFVGGKDKRNDESHYLVPAGAPEQNPLKFINLRNGAETEVTFQ